MNEYHITFYRMQLEVVFDQATGEYSRPVLQLCWQKPLSIPPYMENGITDITLSEYPELKALIEQATALAVPIAWEKLENINTNDTPTAETA